MLVKWAAKIGNDLTKNQITENNKIIEKAPF